jgi:hypothetical protein
MRRKHHATGYNMKTNRATNFRTDLLVAFACIIPLAAGCASQITTANSVITTICQTTQPVMMNLLREVVAGMNNYKLTQKSQTDAIVKYNPSNPLMGSATVQVRASQAAGMTKEGEQLTGIELIYTDVTPLMSQDTSFGGEDIISQLKSAVDEYTKFHGITCKTVKR